MKQPRWARPSGAAPAWSETFSAQTSLNVMAPRADEPRPDPGRGSLLSVVVLASADRATHRAEDPQDDANDHKEVADGRAPHFSSAGQELMRRFGVRSG